MGEPDNYRYIIDSLLNLPLLFWASDESSDTRYREKALAHAHTTLANSIRPDHSTHHTFYMDPATGAPVRGATTPGYRDESAWARGQAWGIAGMAVCYRATPQPAYLDVFENLHAYYLDHLPDDLVPYWVLAFADGDEPRNSSSAAIVACGLLEMAGLVGAGARRRDAELARRFWAACGGAMLCATLRSPTASCCAAPTPRSRPSTAVAAKASTSASRGATAVFRGLTRLSRPWMPFW